MPCPHEGPGPCPGVSACPSLPSRPRDKASPGQTEGRVIGPGAWLEDAGWTCWRSFGVPPIERGDLLGFRGAGGRKPPSASATLFTPAGFPSLSVCAHLSLSLSNSPPRICFLAAAHAFSGPGWHRAGLLRQGVSKRGDFSTQSKGPFGHRIWKG